MDDTQEEVVVCVGFLFGLFACFSGVMALITQEVRLVSRRTTVHLQGEEAVFFGWVTFVIGFVCLTITIAYFWNGKRH